MVNKHCIFELPFPQDFFLISHLWVDSLDLVCCIIIFYPPVAQLIERLTKSRLLFTVSAIQKHWPRIQPSLLEWLDFQVYKYHPDIHRSYRYQRVLRAPIVYLSILQKEVYTNIIKQNTAINSAVFSESDLWMGEIMARILFSYNDSYFINTQCR